MKINLQEDTEIIDILDKVISGCMPHDNYESNVIPVLLNRLNVIFEEGELDQGYYVILKSLNNLLKVSRIIPNFEIKLTREILETALVTNIDDLVIEKDVHMEEWLQRNGLDSNFAIPRVLETAKNKLYTITLDLYDKIFALKISSSLALSHIPSLVDMIKKELVVSSIKMQARILNSNVFWKGKNYTGTKGVEEYTTRFYNYLKARTSIVDNFDSIVTIDSIDKQIELINQSRDLFKPLFFLGLKPIDSVSPITQHSYVVIVGEEGLGKTHMAVSISTQVIMQGFDVIYMTGEAQDSLIHTRLQANYLYKTKGYKLDSKIIPSIEDYDEDTQKAVRAGQLDLLKPTNGRMHYLSKFTYENFEDEVAEYMERFPNTKAIIIDHSLMLKSINPKFAMFKKQILDEWSSSVINVKKKYGIAVIVLSHPGSSAKKEVTKGSRPTENPTAVSGNISKDADYVLILSANDEEKQQHLIRIAANKIRNFDSAIKPFIVETNFKYSGFDYREVLNNEDLADVPVEQVVEEVDEDLNEYEDIDEFTLED